MTLQQELLARLRRAKESSSGIKLTGYELQLIWDFIEPPIVAMQRRRPWWKIWGRK